jgi:hypothetical protein
MGPENCGRYRQVVAKKLTFHFVLVEVEWIADGDVGEGQDFGRLRLDGRQQRQIRQRRVDEVVNLK